MRTDNGLSLLQPILNANASRYQVEAARARTEQALQQYQQTVQQAFRKVSDVLNDTAQFNAVHAAQQEQVRALSRSSRLAQLRYASGYSSYLEVLDANRELFAAELALSRVQRDSLGFARATLQGVGGRVVARRRRRRASSVIRAGRAAMSVPPRGTSNWRRWTP
ncbi:MAG: TolC family protein [Gammaproteobacteria bacterium]